MSSSVWMVVPYQVTIEVHTPQFLGYERSRPTENTTGETP